MAESPNGTLIASPDAVITDAQGNTWSLQDGQVAENGVPDPTTANVIALAYAFDGYGSDANGNFHVYGQVWQENASRLWWAATSAGWSPTYGTTDTPVLFSADGAVITPGDPTPLLDSSDDIWTISNGQVVKNGAADPLTANVIEMEYKNGVIWQENNSHLWWSYSQASDGSTVWTPGTPPVSRAWVGGGNNNAGNPNDWSPAGVPAPGDTLTITSGTINIRDNALAGDTLTVPPPSTLDTPAYKPYTPTINLIRANASIATGEGGNTVAVNVSGGTSRLSLNSTGTTVNVQVASNSTLIMNDNVSLSTLNVSGGTISFIGSNNFAAFKTVFNDRLTGTATINEAGGNASGESMEVNGAVGRGLTFNLSSIGPRDVGLQIDHPDQFHGTINTMDGFVAFMGLHATRGEILNGVLQLFDGDKLVDATRFTGPTSDPYGGVLQLQQNSAGVMFSNEIGDSYQPGGIGTALPLSIRS